MIIGFASIVSKAHVPLMQSSKQTNSEDEPNVELLAPRQKQLIGQALMARFAAFLKPGESLDLDAEKSEDYVYATLVVTSADNSFRLDLEASVLAADLQVDKLSDPDAYLDLAFEFLKLQLYEFFRQDRQERFHIDWRLYPVEKATIRFRGEATKPSLEREADAMLEEAGPSEHADELTTELLARDQLPDELVDAADITPTPD
ncbi:MAG: hypothetical protein ACLFVJ_19055 [Persicimonas sp.]